MVVEVIVIDRGVVLLVQKFIRVYLFKDAGTLLHQYSL